MKLHILPQPDDVTCGPTSLHAVYDHFGLEIALDDVIRDVDSFEEGGTLAVLLGLDALRRGFDATLYTYNLDVFDPTWSELDRHGLLAKLEEQLAHKRGARFAKTTQAYQAFLTAGGQLRFDDLTPRLLKGYLGAGQPVLAGLSATSLYKASREYTVGRSRAVFDDVKGHPVGHFVVLAGIEGNLVTVADPFLENPISGDHFYNVRIDRLIRAILLGVVTYDGNLLVISSRA